MGQCRLKAAWILTLLAILSPLCLPISPSGRIDFKAFCPSGSFSLPHLFAIEWVINGAKIFQHKSIATG
jgi:hypothetical protein